MLKDIPNSENNEILTEAVQTVANLYLSDNLAKFIDVSISERDEIWNNAASEFEQFSPNILALREAKKIADNVKDHYPQSLANGMGIHFRLTDIGGKQLLTDILIARTADGSKVDSKIRVTDEARAMLAELGGDRNLQDPYIEALTIDDVVEKVLIGKLKLTSQTNLY